MHQNIIWRGLSNLSAPLAVTVEGGNKEKKGNEGGESRGKGKKEKRKGIVHP